MVVSGAISLVKFLFYVCLAVGLIYLAYRYRHQLLQWWIQLVKEWNEFLNRLLGRSSAKETVAQREEAVVRQKSFAEYPNPFVVGVPANLSMIELVRYTFEAFEAWAAERGMRRKADQTPHELLCHLLERDAEMFRTARSVIDVYYYAAYARGSVGPECIGSLERLWQQMAKN